MRTILPVLAALTMTRGGAVNTWFRVQGLLYINVQRFRGGLVFKAHRLLYHSTLGLRVTKKKKKVEGLGFMGGRPVRVGRVNHGAYRHSETSATPLLPVKRMSM